MEALYIALAAIVLYIFMGGPIPFCFGLALMIMHYVGGIGMKGLLMFGLYQLTNPILLSVPLFVFAGKIMAESGIAKHLLNFVNDFVGHIKGGLGVVSVVTCAILGAVSGSAMTGVAATAPIMLPRMLEEGYPRNYASALITTSSVLGLLIPPSITMISYGWLSDTSIVACFMATLVPGLVITFLFSIINIIWVRRFNLNVAEKLPIRERFTKIRKDTSIAFPALLMPIIILGGIYGGMMTPTEASAVAVLYGVFVGFFVYKGLTKESFKSSALESSTGVSSMMLMIMICLSLGQTWILIGAPQAITEAILSVTTNKYLILLLINVIYIIMGMLVTDLVSMLLTLPLLLPLMAQIGIHPVHFGAIVGVNLAMGVVTPPYASLLYLGIRICKADFAGVLRVVLVLLVFAYLPVLLLTTYWPPLSLGLPKLLGLI